MDTETETEIIQSETTLTEASRWFVIPPSEIEESIDKGRKGMEDDMRAEALDVREQYERQLRERHESWGKPGWSNAEYASGN